MAARLPSSSASPIAPTSARRPWRGWSSCGSELGKGDDALSIVFISVDPERDGPAEVGSYASLFNAPVIGLTGSPAEIERVKKQFGVYSAKVAQPGGGYSVDHSAAVFLMDRDGKFVATLSPDEGDPVALDKLRRIS